MMRYTSLALFLTVLSLCSSSVLFASASPFLPLPAQLSHLSGSPSQDTPVPSFSRRTDGSDGPQFPDQPPSCPICAQNYGNISSCAQAAPVLQNFTMIIFNPGAFIDVIKCACVDTFQSTYPQCVDCFIRTNQTSFLDADSDDLPGVVDGMRKICALESTLLGGVQSVNGEVTPTSAIPTPTSASNGAGAAPLLSSWSALVFAPALGLFAALL